MATPNALRIKTHPGKESVLYVSGELYERVTGRIVETFEGYRAWRGGNVQSIVDLATRAENAERELRAILNGDAWHDPVNNEAVRASVKRVLDSNAKLTGNY